MLLVRPARRQNPAVEPTTTRRSSALPLIALASVLLVGAVAVRGIAPPRAGLPKDAPVDGEKPRLREPMQLLGPRADLRAAELDAFVSPARIAGFVELRKKLFAARACPPLLEWANSAEGQGFERVFGELRTGSEHDGLAALVLLLRVARTTEWKPGLLAKTEHAEKLGAWLQDWLRTWAEPSADDPLLAEPAQLAALVYGHVMRTAWDAPVVGHKAAPYERAVSFLGEIVGAPPARRTKFGDALQARFPRAMTRLFAPEDALLGLAEECRVLQPDLDGECDD